MKLLIERLRAIVGDDGVLTSGAALATYESDASQDRGAPDGCCAAAKHGRGRGGRPRRTRAEDYPSCRAAPVPDCRGARWPSRVVWC